MKAVFILLSAVFLLSSCVSEKTKVDELMSRMTLEEKLGQLNCLVAPRGAVTGEQQSTGVAEKVRSGAVGSLFGRHDRDELKAWQKMAVEESRLGIPLLFGADIIHGYRTTFPVPLALAATWNPESMGRAARISTVEASSDGLTWLYNPMVDICRDESEMIREAVSAARRSDVVLAAVGEPAWMTGEASSRTSLDIPQPQKRLLEALVKTGKPVVVLLFSGRPMTLEWEDENMAAVLDVWYGGSEAADAILDVIYGKVNPSGKLTMTFPRNVGQIPIYYNMKRGGRPAKTDSYKRFSSSYMDSPNSPLYPFGYGLGYTTYEYSDFALSADAMPSDGSVTASVKVTNTGSRDGDETVQLYIHDVYSSMTRPVKELKAFRKIHVKAGQTVEVSFEITPDMLSWYYMDPFETGTPQLTLEPGDFEIMVGPDSAELQTLMLNISE